MHRQDSNIGQGRNGDVPQDPDGWWITLEFYGCVTTIGGAFTLLWWLWP